ncbi:hypothetical protein FO519_003045 [Halicephalobus sp. NKZ332]|nr:hypothetical protein FO519_003045 [Halicephalobus sp. NKZ332]
MIHHWTFDGFVERIHELSLAPKKFLVHGFKTLIKEFEFEKINPNTNNYLLKDIFLQKGTVYNRQFPPDFIKELFGEEAPCPENKDKIKDEHMQSMAISFKKIHEGISESKPSFEEVINAIQFIFGDVKKGEAVDKLSVVRGLDVVGLEYVFRIMTNCLASKLACSIDEIKSWFDEYESTPRLLDAGLVGVPQKPMLLVKLSTNISDYNDKIIKSCGDRFMIETKFDGERVMVHKSRNIYKFYSRNGINYSEKLGRDSSRHFAARIDPLFEDFVESCILDGELLVWDRKLERLVGKNEKASDGKIYDVKNLQESKDDDDCVVTRAICVFDVIHLNGTDLVDWTLAARLRQLKRMFKPEGIARHTLFTSTYLITENRRSFLDYYNKAMETRLEGIVVKNLYSTYQFGARAVQNGWFKVKPDYGSQHTLDLATIAVKMEKSGKSEKVHSILVGALKSKDPLLFKVVGSVQPTMKRIDKERLFRTLKGDEGGYRNNTIPDWVDFMMLDKNLRFIHLNNICVVEVRASGLMRGYLRFPSIVGIRADKDVLDVDTFEMVQDYENSIRKAIDVESDQTTRIARKRKIQASLPAEFKRFHSINSEGYEVCLIDVKLIKDHDHEELAKMNLSFVANVTKNTTCVVTDEPTSFKMKGIIKQNLVHILKPDWLIRCKEAGKLVPWEEDDFIVKCDNASLDLLYLESSEEEAIETCGEQRDEDADSIGSDTELL